MKNIFLSALLLLSTSLVSLAQDTTLANPPSPAQINNPNPLLRMGLSFSPLLGFFSPDGDPDLISGDGARFTIKYGLHIDMRLSANPNYYFSTGIFLLNTGGKMNHLRLNESGDVVERNGTYRFNYVNLPATFMLRTNEIGYIRYFGRVGVDLGFNIQANVDYRDESMVDNVATTVTKDEDDFSDNVNLFRGALHFEAGFEYNVGGTTNLFLSLEWNNGLNNVFHKDYKDSEGARVKAVSNFVSLNAGVYF
jgi:hypothetical protein